MVTAKIIETNLKEAKAFTGENLGSILLLPSHTKKGALIQYKLNGNNYCKTQTLILSIISNIEPQNREITFQEWDWRLGKQPPRNILTPALLYQFDVNIDNYCLSRPMGYFYRPSGQDLLSEEIKNLTHYFFPHVYFDAHLCYRSRFEITSPRNLYNAFWTSEFSPDWEASYSPLDDWEPGSGGILKSASSPDHYQEFQTSASPMLDAEHQKFLSNYTIFMETVEKPMGIFVTTDLKITSTLDIDDLIINEKGHDGKLNCAVGFAFYRNNEYWIWLKSNKFLRFKPEQLKLK